MGTFSLDEYSRILRAFMANGYQVLPLGREPTNSGKVLFLRHDIDYSLEVAVKLAQVNYELGIIGIFLIAVSNPLYNLAAEASQIFLDHLKALNQVIGLHFFLPTHMSHDQVSLAEIHRQIKQDFKLLQAVVGGNLEPVISWHNPSVLGEAYRGWVEAEVSGLLNAYSLAQQGIAYMADSNHRYTVDTWLEVAQNGPVRLQALFHPFQWVLGADTMEGVLAKTWSQVIRQYEQVFLTNHIYRALFPAGLPDDGLQTWVAPLLETAHLSD